MRNTIRLAAVGLASLTSVGAEASFVRFADCVQECTGGYWRRVAWTLDCELELAACVVTLGGNLAYNPSPDPSCLLIRPLDPNDQVDDAFPFDQMTFHPGDQIPVVIDLLSPNDTYTPADDPATAFGTELDYFLLLKPNLFNGPADPVQVQIVALSLQGFAPIAVAGDNGDPILNGLNHPGWNNAVPLYDGPPENVVLNTNGLGPGTWILRTTAFDQIHGPQHGLSALDLRNPAGDCPADLNGDQVLDFFDVLVFLQAFSDGNLIADFAADGELNFFDVLAFLQAFSDGCP